MDLSRKHHYQNLLNQEVDYIKTYIKGKNVQDARNPLQVWDHGAIHNNQISIVNLPNYSKIIFLKDNVAEWMIFGIMAGNYACTSFEHFDHLLEHDFEQVHKACIDLYYSEIATNNFRQSLQSTYKTVFSFRIVGSEPVGVDPFSDGVPSATPSDFAPCGGCSKQQAPCQSPDYKHSKTTKENTVNTSKYVSGLDMNQFELMPISSAYNNNHYKGFDSDILLGISDDDNVTQWWVFQNNCKMYIGESRTSNNDLLELYDRPRT